MDNIKALLITFLIACSLIKTTEIIAHETLKTSIIIPCHPKHAQYLYELLKFYENQTILPNEVVISLSEANQVDLILKNNFKIINNYYNLYREE